MHVFVFCVRVCTHIYIYIYKAKQCTFLYRGGLSLCHQKPKDNIDICDLSGKATFLYITS
jgi:hypothetical protein